MMTQIEKLGGEVLYFQNGHNYFSQIPPYSFVPKEDRLEHASTVAAAFEDIGTILNSNMHIKLPPEKSSLPVTMQIYVPIGSLFVSGPTHAPVAFIIDSTTHYAKREPTINTRESLRSCLDSVISEKVPRDLRNAHQENISRLIANLLLDPGFTQTLLVQNVAYAFPRKRDFTKFIYGDEFLSAISDRINYKNVFAEMLKKNVADVSSFIEQSPLFRSAIYAQLCKSNPAAQLKSYLIPEIIALIRYTNYDYDIFSQPISSELGQIDLEQFKQAL